MNLSSPFIKRPVMTTLVMLAIFIAGWLAFSKLPVSDLPNVSSPCLAIHTEYNGAGPDVVLKEVTEPIEKALKSVKGTKELSSSSSHGFSEIILTFDLNKNMDEAIRDLQEALHQVEGKLPKNLDVKPTYSRMDKAKEPIFSVILNSASYSVGELRRYSESSIIPRLNRIEGVSQVIAYGSSQAIWIRIDPEKLFARGIGFNQIIDTIKAHTQNLALGKIKTSSKEYSIELAKGSLDLKAIENLAIGQTQVRIKDVATVSNRENNPQIFHYVTKDQVTNALIIAVEKASDANTCQVTKAVKELLGSIKNELPPTVQMQTGLDKSLWIEQSIQDVKLSLLFSFALVIVVIYFSLGRLSDALIPSLALPLSVVGTFIVMYFCNFSLDLLSLLALTLSVGFVVDDAIVVLENIVRHQEKGLSRLSASLLGSKQISFTVLSMTLSLVAVFIPLLFMPGMNGKLFWEFSVTMATAILVSGFISLSLTPMLCSKMLSQHNLGKHKSSFFTAAYAKSLKWLLGYPKTVLTFALLLALAQIPLFTKIGVQLFPPEDRSFLMTFVSLPSGISQKEVNDYQERLEKLIQKNPAIEYCFDCGFPGNLGFFSKLLPKSSRPPQEEVMAEISKAFDSIPGICSMTIPYQLLNLGLDFGQVGQYRYMLRSNRSEDVLEAASRLETWAQKDPTFSIVKSSISNDDPKLIVHLDEERARKFGITQQQLQELLSHAYSQPLIAELHDGAMLQELKLEMDEGWARHLKSLSTLFLKGQDDQLVPLSSLCSWHEAKGLIGHQRHELMPAVELYFSVNPQVSPDVGVKRFSALAESLMPPNVTGSLSGIAKTLSETGYETILLLIAASFVMYFVLGILYESFIHPLTILSSLPFAGLGGILTLYLFDEPISIFSAVGFLLLLGIVKKNGIMMVDYALEAKSKGLNAQEAIVEGCMARLRPITMTTVAAIMGALPIAIGVGEGSEMYRGLGLVIVGGLLFSQLLTLYVTPILFHTFEKLRKSAST